MTRDEAANILKEFIDTYITCHGEEDTVAVSLDNVDVEALEMAIKALEQEPCSNAIDRAEAIYIASGYCHPANIAKELAKLPPVQPKTGHCRDCKWWKDSDGAYRRGIGAESQCPMNRIEVYEGNGYCFLYEPKMQEVEDES